MSAVYFPGGRGDRWGTRKKGAGDAAYIPRQGRKPFGGAGVAMSARVALGAAKTATSSIVFKRLGRLASPLSKSLRWRSGIRAAPR